MFKARDRSRDAYTLFVREGVEKLKKAADREKDDPRVGFLLERYGLRGYFDSPASPFILGAPRLEPPLIIGLGILVAPSPSEPDSLEPATSRSMGLRYQLMPTGQVQVDIVYPPPANVVPARAIEVQRLASAEALFSPRLLDEHWRILRSFMQVQWRDGCPSWGARRRVQWLTYSRRMCRAEAISGAGFAWESVWHASHLSQHAWTSFRWVVTVGCSGLLVMLAQQALPSGDPILTDTVIQVGRDAHADRTALQLELNAVRSELAELRVSLPARSATSLSTSATHVAKLPSRPPHNPDPTAK